jgi:hypothetical protein
MYNNDNIARRCSRVGLSGKSRWNGIVMLGSYRAGCLLALLAIGCVLIVCPTSVRAQSDYHDKDFSVRMASAFTQFTEVSALGRQTVANRYSSASNPAGAGWYPLPGKFGLVAAPYYSSIGFNEVILENQTSMNYTFSSYGPFRLEQEITLTSLTLNGKACAPGKTEKLMKNAC